MKDDIQPINEELRVQHKKLGYWVTKDEVIRHLKGIIPIHYGVVDLYAAYQSEDDFFEIHPNVNSKVEQLNFLIAHRIAIPDDDNPQEVLEQALGLLGKDTFLKRRRTFYEWQLDLVARDHAPANMLVELGHLVEDYNTDVKKHCKKSRWDTVLTGLALIGLGVGTVAAGAPGLLAWLGITAAGGLKAVTLATAANTAAIHIGRRILSRRAPDAAQQVAAAGAMFHQIEDELGWKLRIDE